MYNPKNHSKMKSLPLAVLSVMSASALLATVASAQTPAPTTQKIEKIEVTGSNIKRIEAEGPAAVVIITKADIDKSGSQTVSDLLRNLTQANVGNFSESTLGGNSFAPGTAGVSLRGLGVNTTLTLLNGRRLANYGFGQNTSDAFIDLNSIPLSAIDRIEVLKDGASAIYGSDAIAGVINIILRKDFKGVELATSVGRTSRGDGQEQRYSVTGGFGDLARQRFNVMAVLDYYKRDAVWARDREFSASADQRANGGFDLRSPTGNPGTWLTAGKPRFTDNTVFPACPAGSRGLFSGTTTCFFNFQPFIFLLPPTERKGAFARGVVDITQNLTAFAEFSYNKNETENSAAPTPGAFNLPVGHNSNPYPFTVQIRYRFTDVGPRVSTITSETKRAIVGLKGLGFGWDWEVGYNSSRNEAANRQRQYVSQTAVNSLVSNNIYNFVNQAANTPELVNSLKANPYRIANSELDAIDAKASRELMQLANGPLAVALGVERRKEVAKDVLDPLSAANLIVGSGGTTANGERTLTSAYAEFSIPALKNVEVQAAIRTDNYSGGVGRATKPKLAVSWKVQPNLLVRGSYAGGFRAPSLSEAFLGQTTSFPAFVDTPRCNAYRAAFGTADARSVAVCGSNQVRTLSGGNPSLKPEESKSWLFGAVWEPTNDLNFSLDHYRIDHKEKIRRPSTAFQLNNPQGYPNTIFRDPQSATDILAGAPGVLQGLGSDTRYGLFQSYFNSARQLTEGLDLEGRYRLGLGEMGRLTFVSSTSYVISFQVQTAQGQLLAEQAGTNAFPRTTSTNSVFWNKGNWDTGITARTRSKFLQLNAVTTRNVASYTTADLQVAWTGIKNLRVAVGSTNFLDKKPPFDDNTNDGYQNSTDSPLGRYYYARLTYSWK